MDIGKEIRVIEVEPLERAEPVEIEVLPDPVPRKEGLPERW